MKHGHRSPTAPALLPYMIRNATLLKALSARTVQALRATNKELYGLIYDNTTSVQLRRGSDIKLLLSHSWPQLTTLKLSGVKMCTRSATLLVKGDLTGLQTLDLSHSALHLLAVKQLAKGNWQALSRLNLTGSLYRATLFARKESCQHLATSHWPALTALNISDNYLGATAIAKLCQADWPTMKALDVSCNCYDGSAFMAQIAKLPWTALQDLNLKSNALGVDDALLLGQVRWPQLRRLDLESCFWRLGESDCVAAMHHLSAGQWPELQVLTISHNRLSADSVAKLVRGQWPSLLSLDISFSNPRSQSSPRFVQELANAPWTALRDLSLDSTPLAAQDFSLLGTLASTHITRLSLRGCLQAGGDENVRAADQAVLTDAMQAFTPSNWPCLEALDVSDNNMVDTVVHQLTRCLSPSTSLTEVKLGGNGAACDAISMCTWEYVSMSKWECLSTMDLQGSVLSPEEVDLLLQASPRTLQKLHVSCQVDHVTSARPSHECWPCRTVLSMTIAAGPNLCEVLCSLSARKWPVTFLDIAIVAGQQYELSVAEVEELVNWKLSALQDLHLVALGIGNPQQMPEMGLALSLGHWPQLRKLDLSTNYIGDMFVSLVIDCNWPLLEHVALCDNEIGEDGVWQFSSAAWPNLAFLNLNHNAFTRAQSDALEKRVLPMLHAKWPGATILL